MSHPVKLLGLLTFTSLLLPTVPPPVYSQETQTSAHSQRLSGRETLVDRGKPQSLLMAQKSETVAESQWLSQMLGPQDKEAKQTTGPEAALIKQIEQASQQSKQNDSDVELLLEVEGLLKAGDAVFADDNTLYDTYTFEAEAGQAVIIELMSTDFDPYLWLRDEQGQSIAQNDDASDDTRDSLIAVVLPAAGTYQVVANAYDETGRGAYRLVVSPTQPNDTVVQGFEADTLNRQGMRLLNSAQYLEALEVFERSLSIYREIGDHRGEANSLSNIGSIYDRQGRYQEALGYYKQSLNISAEIGDRNGESTVLNGIGGIYDIQGQYQEALSYYEQALVISVEIGNRSGEAISLNNIGTIHDNTGQYQEALSYYEQSLAILIEIGNRSGEATSLNNIGFIYSRQGQYQEALSYYERALTIKTEIGERSGAATSLGNIGTIYGSLARYQEALDYHERSLTAFIEVGSLNGQSRALNNVGYVYDIQGQYQEALSYYEQSLSIDIKTGDRNGQATTLSNIAGVYDSQGQYQKALDYYERSLAIDIEIGDLRGEATSLNNLGSVYANLGQYRQALTYYERALTIRTKIGDRAGEASVLNNIGFFYTREGEYQKALSYYERSLTIRAEIGDRNGQAILLNNLGGLYDGQKQYQKALSYYEQAFNIYAEIGDRSGEANSLNNIGSIYANQNQHRKALDYYQCALAFLTKSGEREREAMVLNNIGYSLEAQNQPELAIVFYKQSVNVYESIRDQLGGLDTTLQNSYTDSIADTYRSLADLLLQQNRILEAQRVLDLLKVQELEEYLNDVQRSAETETGVDFWQVETDLLALYQQVLAQATELAELEAIAPSSRTTDQQQRLDELRSMRNEAEGWFFDFLDDPDVIATVDQIRASTQGRNLEPESFADLPNNLRQLPQKTAALYPLILDDRLELVLIMPDGPPLRYPIEVTADELNAAIVALGQALKSPFSDIEPISQKLYGWLIAPMAQQLEQAGIESIIYAPDGALRYVPLAALHDGTQYLAERFSISHITADSLSDINLPPDRQNQRMLAAACADCGFDIPVGDEVFSFADLPYTEVEVRAIAEQRDAVDVLLNDAFSATAMAELPSYGIVHLATHAAFVDGSPDESFIVFGSEETINLRQIRRQWDLDNAELVVLSACETAVGSAELGSGIEILGLGYQIERAGAQATLASLWKVSDGGTQVLMNAFYGALQQGMTKTAALQAAQQALITGDLDAVGGDRGSVEIISTATGEPLRAGDSLAHPYYWAPFILIGNSL